MLLVTMEFLMGTTDFHAYPKFMHRVIHSLFIYKFIALVTEFIVKGYRLWNNLRLSINLNKGDRS